MGCNSCRVGTGAMRYCHRRHLAVGMWKLLLLLTLTIRCCRLTVVATDKEMPSGGEISSFFNTLDADADGEIKEDEAREYLQELLGGKEFDTESEVRAGVEAIFTRMDANLGDSVTPQEFMSFLQLRKSPLLSVDAVADWVQHGVRLPQYAEAFRSNAVSLLDFPALANHERLVEDLGVPSRLHRDQLVRALKMQVLGLGKVPGEPKGLVCNATSGGISLQWAPPDNAGVPPLHKYTVERKDDAFGPWRMILPNIKEPYVVDCKGVEPGQEYQYRVTSWGSYGSSVPSTIPCRALPPCTDDPSLLSNAVPCMHPCSSSVPRSPPLSSVLPPPRPLQPSLLQAEPGVNSSVAKRGWLMAAILGPDSGTWSLWRAFVSFQSALLTLGLILRGSAMVRALAGAAWTSVHTGGVAKARTPTRPRSRAPSVSSHSGRRDSNDAPWAGNLMRRSRSDDSLPHLDGGATSDNDLCVNLGDMAAGRVLSRWGTLRAALRIFMLLRGQLPGDEEEEVEEPTVGLARGNGAAGGGGGAAPGGAKMPPLMEQDEVGHGAGWVPPAGTEGKMVRVPSGKSINSVKSSSVSMLSEASSGLDPDFDPDMEPRQAHHGAVAPAGLMGTLGEGERELDKQLRGRSSKHDKISRYRCKVSGCKARFDRWYKVQDWEMVFRKHFCKECQWVFCSKHTRISPHGSTGRCGIDSQCYCEKCFNALPETMQAVLERTNKLRPEGGSPKALHGAVSGAGNGGGSGGSPQADGGAASAVPIKSKPKRGSSMRALLPSSAWPFGSRGKSSPQLAAVGSIGEEDGKGGSRSASERDVRQQKTESGDRASPCPSRNVSTNSFFLTGAAS